MKVRIVKKACNYLYKAIVQNGDLGRAAEYVAELSPNTQRKALNAFDKRCFENLGAQKGAEVIANFAGYRGYQRGMRQVGGAEGIANRVSEQMIQMLNESIEQGTQKAIEALPKTKTEWLKLYFRESYAGAKDKAKSLLKKLHISTPEFKPVETKAPKTEVVKPRTAQKVANALEKVPEEYRVIFANLEGKSGREFVSEAYENMVKQMGLNGIAPKNIIIEGADGVLSVKGGYSPIKNSIDYTKGFLNGLTKEQQLNLIAHELKHCEQYSTILRTEGISVEQYARAIAESQVRNAIKKGSFDIRFKNSYKKALEAGKGEEFIQRATENTAKKIIPQIEESFAEVLKMPKFKADSIHGKKAHEYLEAMKNYEYMNSLGFCSEKYRNSLIEEEAYAFGDRIGNFFKSFLA